MIWNEFHFFSKALDINASVNVLLPDPDVLAQGGGKPVPTLYLLHGLSDDHSKWLRMTRIEAYAQRYRVAIVVPAVNRSFYTDMAHGAKYFTYVSEELPRVMESYFPLSTARAERFAAGLSMGGYGAMKLGLLKPERYAAVASLSGAIEIEEDYARHIENDSFLAELNNCFGSVEQLLQSDNCLTRVADRLVAQKAATPAIYMACGTEDFLFKTNEDFYARYGKALGIEYHTEPGAHTWDFWDRHIERVLAWLPLQKNALL